MDTHKFKPLFLAVKPVMAVGTIALLPFSFSLANATVQSDIEPIETISITAQALKIDTPAQETPKSVSVVNSDDLQTHNVQKLDEAFRYTAGYTSPYGPDNDAEWMFVRGLEPSVYLDGNRLYKEGFFAWTAEPFGLEQIELLKGPSGILYGETLPGGVVNLVQKKPSDIPKKTLSFSGGNKNYLQLGVDVSDWANSDGSQRYRLVALVNQKDGDLDGVDSQRVYVAPSYSMDISEKTSLTLLASFLKDDGVPQNAFMPVDGTLNTLPNGETISADTNYGEPDYDKFDKTQFSLGYQLTHVVNDVWTYNQNFNYAYVDLYLRSSSAYQNYDDDPYTLTRYTLINDGDNSSYTWDNHVLGEWHSAQIDHTLLAGLDIQYHKNDWLGNGSGTSVGVIDSLNPSYGNITDLSRSLYDNEIVKKQLGVYANYQAIWNQQWVLNLGGRFDDIDVESSGTNKDDLSDNQFSINSGVMYIANNGLAPYASYSQSFYVISSLDYTTNTLYKPIESEQTELGIKYTPNFIDGFINLAWFDINQDNALSTAIDGNGAVTTSQSSTKTNITGIELEANVAATDNVTVSATYTYLDASSGEGDSKVDKSLVPSHMATGWITYDVQALGIEGLKVGTGVRYTGTSVDSTIDQTVPAYLLVDAMASYTINKQWDMQVNINNLTDKEYIAGCDYGICYYGESSRVSATVNYNW